VERGGEGWGREGEQKEGVIVNELEEINGGIGQEGEIDGEGPRGE
jgi:hypothetical protein